MKQSGQQIVPEWHSEQLPAATVPSGTLISARSYLVDRIVPGCEVIHLPESVAEGGKLKYRRTNTIFQSQTRPRRNSFFPTRTQPVPQNRIVFDFRHHSPHNWAHLLNMHLPIFFHVTERLGIPWNIALILLPQKTPGYICNALTMFGLEPWLTDDTIQGDGVEIDIDPWDSIRPSRSNWSTTSTVLTAVKSATDQLSESMPRRILLLRRNTRAISNPDAIKTLVKHLGFETIYPEDLTPAEQFAIFMKAEMVIAVHGAGLAPLLYRSDDAPPMKLIELFPCGHITNVYRLMASQANMSWVGVRGKMKPQYVEPAYTFTKPFRAFSLDNFEVDPISLKLALETLKVAT
ncbi:DUF563 domain-containing protein [Roseovarius sp. EL26]|uniref:glycosyltransferase family 61 protein n=1 Tax=Roseovarius sp. EL26 TaxID=2126672 RepID=UPI000EA0BCA8|nr:glycosyltransferase family 61 protein [Roseovarius sp. EL26]